MRLCHLKDSDPKQYFAVKVIERKKLDDRLNKNLRNEISILMKIKNPHVIKLSDVQRTENNVYLITELCNGGDLEKLKTLRGGRFTEMEARIVIQQLVKGFKDIYRLEVMHRDLKLPNILVHFPEYPHDLVGKPTSSTYTVNQKKR